MQSSNSAESLAQEIEPGSGIVAPSPAEPKPFKPQRFEATSSITATWERPAIVMDGHAFQPFRVK